MPYGSDRCFSEGKIFNIASILNKCSDRTLEVEHPSLSGNYERQTDQPTDKPTDRRQGQKLLEVWSAQSLTPEILWVCSQQQQQQYEGALTTLQPKTKKLII